MRKKKTVEVDAAFKKMEAQMRSSQNTAPDFKTEYEAELKMSNVYLGIRRANTIRTTSTTKSIPDMDIKRFILAEEALTPAEKRVLQPSWMGNSRIEDRYAGAGVEDIYKAIQSMPLLERISGIEEQQKKARQEHQKALEDAAELLTQDHAIRDSIQKKFAEAQAKTEAAIQMQLQHITITKDLQARNEEYRTSLEQIISERFDKQDNFLRHQRAISEGYICEAKVTSEAYTTSQRNALEVVFNAPFSEQQKELKTLHETMKDIGVANDR
ncbi:hypothetical protein FPQ18DRAFT_381828 [Pyronema domesticum]|nr:hypothetical protein FPQ18DRAFT_381828 [Pyronema domesticum]